MGFIDTVIADGEAALKWCETELNYLEAEGKAIIAYIEAHVPGSSTAIAQFMQAAEGDAAELAKVAANGMSNELNILLNSTQAAMETFLASTKLNAGLTAPVSAAGVSAVALAKAVGQSAISVTLTNILAALAAANPAQNANP